MNPLLQFGDKVTLVKVGTNTVDPGKIASPQLIEVKNAMGIGGGSTVTVIRDEAEIILIDTGFEREADRSSANHTWNRERLNGCLHGYHLNPRQITKVFLTHLHYDHCGNIEMFPNTDCYCHAVELSEAISINKTRIVPVNDGDRISLNTVVKHTPGHTKGHASLICSTDGIRFAVCGDAVINLAWLLSGYRWRFNPDVDTAEKDINSIRYLLNNADIIIPGHGEPFFSATARLLLKKRL
jgi:glyoxylase-like metal-dependent hydrolase (beta-lactamase superfamily II)